MRRVLHVVICLVAFLTGTQGSARGLVVEAFPSETQTVLAAYTEDRVTLRFSVHQDKVFLVASDSALDLHDSNDMQTLSQNGMGVRLIGNGVFAVNCLVACHLSARAVGSSAVYVTLDLAQTSPRLLYTFGLEQTGQHSAHTAFGIEDPRVAQLDGGHVRIQGSRLRSNLRDTKAILSDHLVSRHDCIYPAGQSLGQTGLTTSISLLQGQSWCRQSVTDIASIAERIVFGVNLDTELSRFHLLDSAQHAALIAEVERLASARRDHYSEVVRRILGAPADGATRYYNDPLTSLLSAEAEARPDYTDTLIGYIDLLMFERRDEDYAYQLLVAYMKEMVEGAGFDRLRDWVQSGRAGAAYGERLENAFVLTSFRHARMEDFLSLVFALDPADYQDRTRQLGADRLALAGFGSAAREWAPGGVPPAASPEGDQPLP